MGTTYDFSKGGSIRPVLMQFIRGIRGPRQNEVTLKQIVEYFGGTPEAFVKTAVDEFLDEDLITIRRTSMGRNVNSRYVYSLTDKGQQKFEFYVRDHACYTG